MSNCKSCGAEIWWVKTAAGKSMPLDPHQNEAGNVLVQTTNLGSTAVVTSLPASATQGTPRYRTHWATCASASAHRRPKGGA